MTHRGSASEALVLPEGRARVGSFVLGKANRGWTDQEDSLRPSPPCQLNRGPAPAQPHRARWAASPGNRLLGLSARHLRHDQHQEVGMRVEQKQAKDRHSGVSVQRSPTLSAPGTSFVEEMFPCTGVEQGKVVSVSPATHILLCGPVPNQPWTRTSRWPGGWGPLS